MKKFRKLIPAFCMLLISAVLLGTSTYAWFSMNTSVTATGLSVTAKADYIYLLVGESSTTLTSTNAKATMQGSPASYGQDITLSTVTNTTLAPSTPDTTKVTNDTAAAVPGNWYTANSDDPDESNPNSTDKTDLTAGNFAEYVIKKTLFVTLATGSDTTSGNTLKVTVTLTAADGSGTKTIDAVKVLVANSKTNTAANATSGTAITIGAITDADLVQLDFYIYYDGKDDSVFTSNFANLDGASVQILLTVE